MGAGNNQRQPVCTPVETSMCLGEDVNGGRVEKVAVAQIDEQPFEGLFERRLKLLLQLGGGMQVEFAGNAQDPGAIATRLDAGAYIHDRPPSDDSAIL